MAGRDHHDAKKVQGKAQAVAARDNSAEEPVRAEPFGATSETVRAGPAAPESDEGAGRLRLPTIDDYDWEKHIEEFARRLAPLQQAAEDDKDDEGEREESLAPTELPSVLKRARPAHPARWPNPHAVSWPESPHQAQGRPPSRIALAVVAPLLAVAIVAPFVHNIPEAWAERVGWLLGEASEPRMTLVVQPAPRPGRVPVRPRNRVDETGSGNGTAVEAVAPVFRHPLLAAPAADQVDAVAFTAALERPTRSVAVAAQRPGLQPPRAGESRAAGAVRSESANSGRPAGRQMEARSARLQAEPRGPARSAAPAGDQDAAAREPTVRRLDGEEIEALLARGNRLLELGDIASARLLFRLVAEGGDPRGAKAMGMTFDPSVFAGLPVAGMAHDRAQAEIWYDKSDEMPAPQATADQGM